MIITIGIYALWFAGGAVLVIYPGILLANVMNFAAHKHKDSPLSWAKRFPLILVGIVSTFYPVIYYIFLKQSQAFLHEDNPTRAALWALPCALLAITFVFYLKRK